MDGVAPRTIWSRLASGRWGVVVGAAALLLGLLQYQSQINRPVLDRWSYAHTALLAVLGLVIVVLVVLAIRRPRTRVTLATVAFDVGCAFLGIGYAVDALAHPPQAGRIGQLNFFGAADPVPSLLAWLALANLFLAACSALWRRTSNGRLREWLLSIAAILGMVVLIEGGLRVFFAVSPMVQGFPTYAQQRWDNRYVSRNSEGFRDMEHPVTVPSGLCRVLVIGDSLTHATGIRDPNQRFGERLAAKLSERTNGRWQSITFAREHTHTLDHIRFLERALQYRPDLVILLYSFNDIDYLAQETPVSGLSPYGLLTILYRNFDLVQQTYLLLKRSLLARGVSGDPDDPYADRNLVERHLSDIRAFMDRAERAGARAMLVPFDVRIARRARHAERYERFSERARERAIEVITLAREVYPGEYEALIVNWLDHHPNEIVHEAAAAHVAAALRAEPGAQQACRLATR